MKVGVASKLMTGSSLLASTQVGTFNFRRLSSINCVISTGGLANVMLITLPSDISKFCIQLFQRVSLFFKTINVDLTSTMLNLLGNKILKKKLTSEAMFLLSQEVKMILCVISRAFESHVFEAL